MNNPRIISNEQLDMLYEIRDYFLENAKNFEDERVDYCLELCDNLLEQLDPSSDYNMEAE